MSRMLPGVRDSPDTAKPQDNSLAQGVAECGSLPWQWDRIH